MDKKKSIENYARKLTLVVVCMTVVVLTLFGLGPMV
jgi:Tfp pilus assembly protein PilX